MNEKSIAIIGYGYVGKAIEAYFKDHFRIALYDPYLGYSDKEPINNADLAIVCVPTPMQDDGSVDLSAINEIFAWIKTPLIVIKSTVPPGTTERLAKTCHLEERLVFSPEYIGEGNYPTPFWKDIPDATDMKRHSFFIFGGHKKATAPVMEFFKRVSGAHARYMYTDSTTAELVKYMNNAWLATKVTFMNEFFEIAERFDVDYNALRELVLLDGRVGASHTLVYTEKRGFGGKCLPKDVNGIVKAAEEKGYAPKLLKEVLESNKRFRKE